MYVPALVYLGAVVVLVAAGEYTGSHRYLYPALPSLALLAASQTAPPAARQIAHLEEAAVKESSGIVASHQNPGLYWTHNDSGGGPKLYALDADTCETVAVLSLRGVPAKDIEAIAAGVDL